MNSSEINLNQAHSFEAIAILHFEKQDVNKKPEETQEIESQSSERELTYEQKKNYAYCLAIHLSLIRHWIGGNAIISQGGLFIGTFDATLGKYTPIIINCIQFAFVIVGLVFVQKHFGKRSLFLFSITMLSLLNLGVAVAMIFEQVLAC
jgi:hypothetical protein